MKAIKYSLFFPINMKNNSYCHQVNYLHVNMKLLIVVLKLFYPEDDLFISVNILKASFNVTRHR